MKKLVQKMLPAAIAMIGAMQATAEPVAPIVYGKMSITTHMNSGDVETNGSETTDKDFDELSSNASRIGVMGSNKLTETLNAIYKMEYEIAIDDGEAEEKDELKARNMYIGVQSGWGTLIAGKNDTPLKLAQDKIDLFNDLPMGDLNNTFVGENRESNILIYTTPEMKGFAASVAIMPGEENEDTNLNTGGDKDGEKDNGLSDGISYSFSYRLDSLYLAFAGDEDVQHTDVMRLVGEYTLGNVTLGAMWQDAEETEDGVGIGSVKGPLGDISTALGVSFEEQDGYLLSAKLKLSDKWALLSQWAESEVDGVDGVTNAETEQLTLGLDYLFSSNTKLFGYYSLLEADGDDGVDEVDVEYDTFAVGMEHKF